jgi:hypothetical protein
MSISGYGCTLAGDVLGALAGIKSIRVGGLSVAVDEIATIDAYRTGHATFTNGSSAVSGENTVWTSAMDGRRIRLDADGVLHRIWFVQSTTALVLTANYTGTGGHGAYTMLPSRVVENLPLAVREQPLEITFKYDKTVYDTLRDAALAQTEDEFTLTDEEGSTDIGDAVVSHCGDMVLGSDGHAQFAVTLMPATAWAFTEA